MTGPLDGIRVIEFTSVVLGPFACQILGDLGADVIKVEPPDGDTNRNLGPVKNTEGLAALFLTCNRNKKSIVLDLKSDEGREAALKLIATADVVVHNFRPKAMEKLGLDYQAVKKINPDIIYCATYGFSKKGPYGDKGALDDSIQAASGVAMLMKMVEGEPRYLPTIIGDKTTGLNVANAVTSALFHRERKGKGQEIEVPMFETMVSYVMVEHLWGQVFEPPLAPPGYTRLMSKHRRPYKTKDGYIAVLPYWDNHWATFCKLIDREDMISDERFINMKSRLENIDMTYNETGKALAKRTTDEWLLALSETNIPHMHVSELDDLMQNQHLIESEFWEMHQHPTEGSLRMPKLPIYFSESPASIRLMPPKLGAHNEELLSEIGYSEDEINALKEKGITS